LHTCVIIRYKYGRHMDPWDPPQSPHITSHHFTPPPSLSSILFQPPHHMERLQVKASLNNEASKLVEEGMDEWTPHGVRRPHHQAGWPPPLTPIKRLLLHLLHTLQNTQKTYHQLEIPKSKYGLRILSF
jgi:hypothetical protein